MADRSDEVLQCLLRLQLDKRLDIVRVQTSADAIRELPSAEIAIVHPGTLITALNSSNVSFNELTPKLKWIQSSWYVPLFHCHRCCCLFVIQSISDRKGWR
jgi:hypothetical protein